ncbi:hypothetical protein WN48_08392 [Eufriesea mexicana]|uniref:uncharacterized protein LOC108552019 n=1 Tax=Eufriesea mexicana TaxID=516756 RepID=UPI00083BB307|nr:PREDICTED: uncharacterized protein LOC108552019 [Eufriesea mexicana]XP_017761881.1 PREDICTED: uncharacterized protein LOC108552019 [Eufriesea mexicana]XP_017761882.1 PREDICTED: uncharacterized protein LOC108552019 [Eufriesea mexicana]OAD54059.1 hypothetical protein WN48_08392 [Eufriesea mexicana]
MFCLKGKNNDDAKFREMLRQDDFGWWLSDEDDLKSPRSTRSRGRQSVGSSESMFSCIDSDDSESYFLAQELKQEYNDNCEKIELTSLIHGDLDVNLIEQDAICKETDVTRFVAEDATPCSNDPKSKSQGPRGMCYTPERLVRSQEYRILTPSPRYLSISQARIVPENENPQKAFHCRRRLNCLIDSKQTDAMQLQAVVGSKSSEIVIPTIGFHDWRNYKRACSDDNETKISENETKMEDVSDCDKSDSLQTPDSIGKSYEKLNVTWENCGKMGTRSSSLDDTSGIQSNDWSSDSHSDLQNTPLCLCDELATTNYKLDTSQERCSAINEVVSILEVLDTNPEKATVLLEEDRFCGSNSTHDQLTRLALAIETDANGPGGLETPEHLVEHLQNKIKKLQDSSKDIFRDISNLRESFQCDEQKMADISSNTRKLREDVHELRYLDDLLNLLRGELERISKRNWPFVIGRTNHHSEEMNLIV